jgi:hypothetical protein
MAQTTYLLRQLFRPVAFPFRSVAFLVRPPLFSIAAFGTCGNQLACRIDPP